MSFERSIIIPLKLYTKCKLPTTDADAVDILTNDTLPSDTKLKLYDQAVIQSSSTSSPPSPPELPRGQHILHNIPDKDKPVVASILDIIKDNESVVNFSDNLEVIIDGHSVPGSNIVSILLYLTGNVPVTSSRDIPTGSDDFYQRLVLLGMPSVWIKPRQRPKRQRTSSRLAATKKRKVQWESV
jgi:hypothetical protein